MHKRRHASVKNMSIDVPRPRSIIMVKPLRAKDKHGKTAKIDGAYVDMRKSGKSSGKHRIFSGNDRRDLFVHDLNPFEVYVDWNGIDETDYRTISVKELGIKHHGKTETSIMVIDSAKWRIDTSAYEVAVTEETYAELAEMKFIYDFEKLYGESVKSEAKLNDVRKLDRKLYLRWIEILNDNKTCKIELIKSTK